MSGKKLKDQLSTSFDVQQNPFDLKNQVKRKNPLFDENSDNDNDNDSGVYCAGEPDIHSQLYALNKSILDVLDTASLDRKQISKETQKNFSNQITQLKKALNESEEKNAPATIKLLSVITSNYEHIQTFMNLSKESSTRGKKNSQPQKPVQVGQNRTGGQRGSWSMGDDHTQTTRL